MSVQLADDYLEDSEADLLLQEVRDAMKENNKVRESTRK